MQTSNAHNIALRSTGKYLVLLAFLSLATSVTYAALGDIGTKFIPLVGLPGLPTDVSGGMAQYVNALYVVLIGGGSLIAVIQIMIAGVQWSMSDKLTSKSNARERIQGTLFGLALLLIPFIVLNTINPDLVKLNVLDSMGKFNDKYTSAPSNLTSNNETLTQLNQRTADSCLPVPGKATNPMCPSDITPQNAVDASVCSGYYDLGTKKCQTTDSTQTYDTSKAGGNQYSSKTLDGWSALCGGVNKVKQVDEGNMVTYSCIK